MSWNLRLHSEVNGFGPPSQRTGTARIAASPILSATRSARNVIVFAAEGGVEVAAETSADVTKECQMVFQCRQKPKTMTIQGETMNFRKKWKRLRQ